MSHFPENTPSSPTAAAAAPSPANSGSRLALWTGWTAALGFALATAYFGAHYVTTRSETLLLRNDAELARTEAQSLAQRLEAERILNSTYIEQLQKSGDLAHIKIAKLTAPAGDSTQPIATVLWNPLSQQGLLLVEKLPVLETDHDYQLWLSDPAHADPVNAGIVTPDATGAARIAFRHEQSTTNANTFTLRRERKGGASKPEGPMVATGTL